MQIGGGETEEQKTCLKEGERRTETCLASGLSVNTQTGTHTHTHTLTHTHTHTRYEAQKHSQTRASYKRHNFLFKTHFLL